LAEAVGRDMPDYRRAMSEQASLVRIEEDVAGSEHSQLE
jgi:hypothetical protein